MEVQWFWVSINITDHGYKELQRFRELAHRHMIQVVSIKRRKAQEMERLLAPESRGHLIASTLDAFVKWRAGEIKGILDRRLPGKEVKLVCLKEAESVDVKPAMVIRT